MRPEEFIEANEAEDASMRDLFSSRMCVDARGELKPRGKGWPPQGLEPSVEGCTGPPRKAAKPEACGKTEFTDDRCSSLTR